MTIAVTMMEASNSLVILHFKLFAPLFNTSLIKMSVHISIKKSI